MGHELKRRQGREMELAQGGLPVDWSGQVLNCGAGSGSDLSEYKFLPKP